MDNASRGFEAREVPEKHLETMLVGKDLRTQLNELVVAYGEESLKLNPDEAFMSDLTSRMDRVGEKLKTFSGSSEDAIYNYNKEAEAGADERRLDDLAKEVDRHEQLDTLGQAEAVARYGAVAVAHGEKAPVLEHLGQNIDNMTVSGSEDGAGSGSSSSETDELAPVLSPDAKEPTSIRDDSASSVEGKSDTAPADADEKEPTTEPTVDVEPTPAPESEPDATDAESAPAPTDEAEPVVEPDPETPSPVVDNPEGNLVDDGDVVLEGPVLDPVSPESPDGGDDVEGVEDEPAIVEGEIVDDGDGVGAEEEIADIVDAEILGDDSTADTTETEPPRETGPAIAGPEAVAKDDKPETAADSPERNVEFADNPFRLASVEVQRPYQRDQDVTLRDDKNGLYGVFDGMGSADDSRRVAETAARVLQERSGEVESSQDAASVKRWLEECLGQAHNETVDINGATTASVVKVISDNEGKRRAVWASVGDSRIYLASNDGTIRRLTKDEGGLDEGYPGNIVTNIIGVEGQYVFKQSGDFELNYGDRLLILSDGITGDEKDELLSDQEVANAVNGKTAENAAQRLIEISRKHDDKSAVIVDVLSEDGEPISRSDVIADEPEIGTTPLSDRVIHRVGGLAELRPDPESKPALEELREVAERTGQVVSSLRQVGGKMFGKYYEKAREAIGAKPPIEDIDEAGPVTKKTIPRPVRPTNTPRAKRKEGFEPSGAESDSLRPDLTVSPLGYEVTEAAAKVATDIGRANEWVGSRLRQPESVSVDSVSEPGDEISAEVAEATPEEALTVSQKALNEVIESEKRLADFNKRADRGPQNDPVVNAAKDEMRRVLEQQLTDAQLRYDKSQYFEDVKDGLDIPGWVNGDDSNPERDDIIHLERLASGESYKPGFKAVDADTAFDTLPEGIGVREMAEQSVETPEPAQASIESDGGDAAISEGSGEPLGVEKQEPLSIAEHEKAVKNLREKLDILKQATAEGTEGKDLRDAIAWLQTWDEMIWSRPADEDYEKSLRGRKKLTERLTSIIDAKAKEIPEDDQVNLDDFRVAREAIEATNAPVVAADEKAQRQHRKEKGLRRDDEDVAQRLRDNLLDLYLTSSPTTNIAQEGMNFTALRLLQVDELLGKPMSQATTDQLSAAFDFREGYTSSLIDAITREQSVLDSQAGKKNVERLQALERTLRTLKRESFPGTLGDVGHLAGEEAGKIFRRRMEGLEAFRGRVVSRIPGLRPATSNTPKEPLMGRPIWADGLDVPDWVNGNYKRPKRDELLESYGRGSKQGDERLDADAAFYTLPEGLTADSEINPEPASEPEFIETVQSPTESDGGGAATSEGPGESVEASTSDVTEIERQLGDELDAANKNNDEANSELNAWIASLNEADKERALKQIDGGQIPSQIQAAEDAYARQSEALSRRSVVVFQGLGAETGIAPDQEAGEELRRRQVSERQLLDAHLEVRTALLRATIVGDSAGAEQFLAEIRQHSDAYLDAVQQRVLAELEVSRRDGKAPFTSQAV